MEADAAAGQAEGNVWQGLDGVDIARMVAATRAGRRTHGERIDRLAAIKRLKSWVAAAEFEQLTEIAGTQERVSLASVDGRRVAMHDVAVAEIALATRSSETEVRRDLAAARIIEESLPDVKAGLVSGAVNEQQARAIARAAERVPEQKRAGVAAALLPAAEHGNAQVLCGKAERVIAEIDPDGGAARRIRAQRRRAVWVHDEEDGNSLLCARLATVDAHACLRIITDRAANTPPTDPTSGHAQPDALPKGVRLATTLVNTILATHNAERIVVTPDGEILEHDTTDTDGSAGGSMTSARGSARGGNAAGVRATVFVTIDLATLLGLQDSPITIDGSASVPAQQLHGLLMRACDVEFRRLITDPDTGRVLDVGQRSYRPPAALQRHVQARDGCCQWPQGCTVPADQCDMDHMVPFEAGGTTSADNLLALCRWHHLLKTFHGYTPTRAPDGSVQWTLPRIE